MNKRLLIIALFSIFMILTACGTSTNDDDVDEPEEVGQGDEESAGDEEIKTITETGTYVGQADPHTIEIETAEGPTAFQLTMEARDLVEDLNSGDEVTYTYYKDGEQLVIESISKTDFEDATGDDKFTETGTYVGQADPHTIEIETAEGPTAFQLTMDARNLVEDLNSGDEVTYTYYKDGEQLVIESIEKVE